MLPHHHLYGIAWGAAGLVWMLCGTLRLTQGSAEASDRGRAFCLLAVTTLAALAGARLHFVLLAPALLRDGFRGALAGPLDEGAGLRITGGLIVAAISLVLLAPWAVQGRLGRAQTFDRLVPAAGIALAVGRLGCFADGCCFGIPSSLPWAVRFPAGSPAYWSHVAQGLIPQTAPQSLSVHPVQLYLGAAGLVACLTATVAARRGEHPGTPTLVFVVVLSALRAVVEPLRESSFGIGVAHQSELSAALAVIALAVLLGRRQRRAALGGVAS